MCDHNNSLRWARVFDSMNAIRFVRVFLSARLNRQHSGELQGSAPPFIVTGSYIDTRLSEDASSDFVVNTLNAATVPCLHVNIDMTKCCLSSRYPPVDSTNDSTVLRMFPMVRSVEPIYEYACHEGNYAMAGILGGWRRLEALGLPGQQDD